MFTEQERVDYERARRVYEETKARRESLEGKDKKLFELLEGVDIGNYSPSCSEIMVIASVYDNNAINSCMSFFRLGFVKGQRAEKARQKKKKTIRKRLASTRIVLNTRSTL